MNDQEKVNFFPSQYQEAIFNWVSTGSGDALVEAVAGSGKTTTLIESSKLIKNKRILFCAFNKYSTYQDLPVQFFSISLTE